MQIKTLAEILAEQPVSDKGKNNHTNKAKSTQGIHTKHQKKSTTKQTSTHNKNKRQTNSTTQKTSNISNTDAHHHPTPSYQLIKKGKAFHPASPYRAQITPTQIYTPPDTHTLKSILAQVKSSATKTTTNTSNVTDVADVTVANQSQAGVDFSELPTALHAYLKTPEQRVAQIEQIKADSRLRWLAFYYLSRREHSAAELKQKLLDKEQDPKKLML